MKSARPYWYAYMVIMLALTVITPLGVFLVCCLYIFTPDYWRNISENASQWAARKFREKQSREFDYYKTVKKEDKANED